MINKINSWLSLGKIFLVLVFAVAAFLVKDASFYFRLGAIETRHETLCDDVAIMKGKIEILGDLQKHLIRLEQIAQTLVDQGQARQISLARFEERVEALIARITKLEQKLP